MDGDSSNKRQGEAQPEGQDNAKRQNVTMGMDTLDCHICSQPLEPPIFQCPKGDFICSPCHDKLPENERTASQRSYGMERVVNSIFVPCKHGCTTKITYYEKEEHEMGCPRAPWLCPVSGCGFAGLSTPLLNHLTTFHKLPTKTFKYFTPFDMQVQPGSHVLRGGYGHLFLLEVASLESLGHAVSLVCAEPKTSLLPIRCSIGFSCFEGHYQVSSLLVGHVGSSPLSDGLPAQCFCIVPKVSGGQQTNAVLRITIGLLYDHHEELEEEDSDDGSYNVDEDDNMTATWRIGITEVVVEDGDGAGYEEEQDPEKLVDDDTTITITARTRWMMTVTKEEEKADEKDDDVDDHNGD